MFNHLDSSAVRFKSVIIIVAVVAGVSYYYVTPTPKEITISYTYQPSTHQIAAFIVLHNHWIEEEAEKIRSEASEKAEEIIRLARREAEKLILDAERRAGEVVNKLAEESKASIRRRREEIMRKCDSEIGRLREKAEKRKDVAVNMLFKILIGEKKD